MYKYIIILGLFFLLYSGCKQEELISDDCIQAKVIGPQYCPTSGPHNFYLVQILNLSSLGNEIKYYDGTDYNNVVEVLDLPELYKEKGKIIQFQYKIPDTEVYYACDAMYYTYDVPQVYFIDNCDIKE